MRSEIADRILEKRYKNLLLKIKVQYKTSDGKLFDTHDEAVKHEWMIPTMYEIAMDNRSWFRKLFNLKPKL